MPAPDLQVNWHEQASDVSTKVSNDEADHPGGDVAINSTDAAEPVDGGDDGAGAGVPAHLEMSDDEEEDRDRSWKYVWSLCSCGCSPSLSRTSCVACGA